jgi:predicted phosphodiesterase
VLSILFHEESEEINKSQTIMEGEQHNLISIPTTINPNGLTIVCISDTHGQLHKIEDMPRGDVIVHAGDATRRGDKKELTTFYKAYGSLEHPVKLFISGNHELTLDPSISSFNRECSKIVKSHFSSVGTIRYLEDEEFIIHIQDSDVRIKVYGSPWQPKHYCMAFNLRRGTALREKWEKIPPDTDILLTHTPPHGILDKNYNDESCGCEELKQFLDEKRISPRLHVFGHIHEEHGYQQRDNVLYVNAATCNTSYKPVNAPIVVFFPHDRNLPAQILS